MGLSIACLQGGHGPTAAGSSFCQPSSCDLCVWGVSRVVAMERRTLKGCWAGKSFFQKRKSFRKSCCLSKHKKKRMVFMGKVLTAL